MNKSRDSVARNPAAWLLGGLLALSVFFHYRTGAELTRIREIILGRVDDARPPYRARVMGLRNPPLRFAKVGSGPCGSA